MADRAVRAAKQASAEGDPAKGLAAVSELRREVERLEVEQVRQALAEGWSWRQIAEALGVTKQAAHRKHTTRPPPKPEPSAPRQRLLVAGEARQAVEHAREEARSLNHPAVEPQHLLIGLLRQGGTSAVVLAEAGLDLDSARAAVRAMGAADEESETGVPRGDRVPVSAAARGAFEQSLREAVARDDPRLGPEHILLALLRDRDGGAADVLGRAGLPAGRLQRLVERAVESERA